MTTESEIVQALKQRLSDYEPPRVERVLAPADLEREVVYAGIFAYAAP
jgi:hypothetical protein